MPTFLEERNVFSQQHIDPVTLWFLNNGAIHRFSDWKEYADQCDGEDVSLLRQCLLGERNDDDQGQLPWTKPPHVKRRSLELIVS